jgi:hypothetical protein
MSVGSATNASALGGLSAANYAQTNSSSLTVSNLTVVNTPMQTLVDYFVGGSGGTITDGAIGNMGWRSGGITGGSSTGYGTTNCFRFATSGTVSNVAAIYINTPFLHDLVANNMKTGWGYAFSVFLAQTNSCEYSIGSLNGLNYGRGASTVGFRYDSSQSPNWICDGGASGTITSSIAVAAFTPYYLDLTATETNIFTMTINGTAVAAFTNQSPIASGATAIYVRLVTLEGDGKTNYVHYAELRAPRFTVLGRPWN